MTINVEAYLAEFKSRMAELDGTFRATVRERYNRELNDVEEAQIRAGIVQETVAAFLIGEHQRGTEPEVVVKAYAIACAGGLGNIASQFDVALAESANFFGRTFIAAIQADVMDLGIYTEIHTAQFEQH